MTDRNLAARSPSAALACLVAFGVAIRLWDFYAPPVDFHPFRQTQTLMVAQNFYEHSMNLFHPMVDWLSTDRTPERRPVGGTELCVVPWLTALLYHVFGVQDWVGRIVPLACTAWGIVYFYRLLRFYRPERDALFGAFLISVSPLYYVTGRVQMPEAFAFAMAFSGLYYFRRWLDTQSRADFAKTAATVALMLLGKPQLVVMGLPFCWLAYSQLGWRSLIRRPMLLLGALCVAPVLAYTAYSSTLTTASGISFAQPQLLNYRKLLESDYWWRMGDWTVRWTTDPFLLVLCAAGAAAACRKLNGLAASIALAGFAMLLIAPGGTFGNPQYLMIFPIAAILPASALGSVLIDKKQTERKFAVAILTLVSLVWSVYAIRGMNQPTGLPDYHCGEWLKQNTPEDALILVGNESPAPLYFAHRMGWISWYENYGEPIHLDYDLINRLGKRGCRYLAFTGPLFDDATLFQDTVFRDDMYRTYSSFHGGDFVVFALFRRASLELPESGAIDFADPASRKYVRGGWSCTAGIPVALPDSKPALEIVTVRPSRSLAITLSADAAMDVGIRVNGKDYAPITLVGANRPVTATVTTETLPEDGRYLIEFISSPLAQDIQFSLLGVAIQN
jgi:hypothetical protein